VELTAVILFHRLKLFDSGITLPDNGGGGGGGGGGCTITIPRVSSDGTSGIAYVLILAIPPSCSYSGKEGKDTKIRRPRVRFGGTGGDGIALIE